MRRFGAALVIVALGLSGCAADDSKGLDKLDRRESSSPSPSPTKSLSMLPQPTPTLTGTLTAELQQSSRDVALGRFQVWITNGLERQVSPTRIVYRDQQLTRPVVGQRLRPIPSGSYRGYPLELVEPTCQGSPGQATVTVRYDGRTAQLPVEDETSVVGRWSDRRCEERAIAAIATLDWAGGIEVQGSGPDAVAIFRLTATPTGRPGGVLHIDTVGGTPLFSAADGDFWTVGGTVRSDGPPMSFDLPAQPARCDPHAFGDSGGATAFLVNVRVEDRGRGQILLRMSPEVSNEAFGYAAKACGF